MTTQEALPRVLCVDDEPDILSGLELQLRSGFDIHTAESGAEGLAKLEQHGPFQVVISDMRMPEMDGAQFLTKVKQASPTTIRILLTGYADVEAAKMAINEGSIFRFLMKPCPKEELVGALTEAVEQGNQLNQTQKLLVQSYELKKSNQKLKSDMMHDLLLGVGTRQLMNISLDYTHNTAINHRIPYSIVLFRIPNHDGYRAIHGPQAGIKALQILAAHIQHMINNTGRLFRYSDDKILLLLNEVTYSDAKALADHIVKTFKDQDIPHWPNEEGVLTIQAGVACYDPDQADGIRDWQSILEQAVTALDPR